MLSSDLADGASSNRHNCHNAVRVEPKTLSFWSCVSLQGGNGYWMNGGQQVHNIKVEDNFFVKLEQDYLTCGHGRVMRYCELYEINSIVKNAGCDRRRGTPLELDGYKYKKVNA